VKKMSRYWLLEVDAPHFSSFSVWRADKTPQGAIWECVDHDVFSAWMKKKPIADVGEYLKKQKYKYRWIREDIPETENKADNAEQRWRSLMSESCCVGK
jgi:hypothetical protein